MKSFKAGYIIFCYHTSMKIQTKYSYEKIWTLTSEKDLLRMIEEEIGDADPKGTLHYVKETVKNGKIISVGSLKFREKKETNAN